MSRLVPGCGEEDHDGVANRRFELSTTVACAPSAAIDFLMDLEKHKGLHPFLISASVMSSGDSHRGPWWDWSIEERPRIGPFRYRLRLRARLTRTSPTSMESRVRALPGCYLRSIIKSAEQSDGLTQLKENVVATAPSPVVGYLARQARSAHTQTYRRLTGVLAS